MSAMPNDSRLGLLVGEAKGKLGDVGRSMMAGMAGGGWCWGCWAWRGGVE
jgi:hypothetical protein